MLQVVAFLTALFGMNWVIGRFFTPTAPTLAGILAFLIPSVWMPTVLALLFMGVTSGASGLKSEVRLRFRYSPGTSRWFWLAVSLPLITTLVAVSFARRIDDGADWTPQSAILMAIGLQVITGAVGEELGWRGFLVPRLAARLGASSAAWVMGVLWAAWHIPAFFTPGMPHQQFPLFSTLLFITAFGAFMGLLFMRASQSVLITIAAHLSLNITTAMGGVDLSSPVFWRIMAASFWLIAIPLTIAQTHAITAKRVLEPTA